MKRPITNVSKSIRRTEALNSQERILSKKPSNQQNRSNKNIKREFIPTAIRRIYVLISLLYGPLLRVAPMKTIKYNLSISPILHRFQPSFCCLDLTCPKRRIRKSKNVWFRFLQDKESQWSSLVFPYSWLQLALMYMKPVTPNISVSGTINSSKCCLKH